ncbi:MAG: lysine--tRNA ligase [Elusimicrobiota bacterium]|nr:lysine--tRNA ligase [Elusimicrobiota bacterium]
MLQDINSKIESAPQPVENIISVRKEKITKLKQLGFNPYPNKFEFTHTLHELREKYSYLNSGEKSDDEVSICGRLLSRREMGKATFGHLRDFTDKLQIYLRQDVISEEKYKIFNELIDIGDYIGIFGQPFKTKTGELTVNATQWFLLSKSIRPLPEKWHGLKDVDIRYRQRYLDLISNSNIKEIFILRAKIINLIRDFLNERDFLEVETPIIQHLPGGAIARPFKTYHNAYSSDLYLRIAPELYLKMLVIGGLERIYELGKSFRNEGVDRRHNPEFTMLEVYQAYSDYNGMLELCKALLSFLVDNLRLSEITVGDKKVNLTDFNIVTLTDLFKQNFGSKLEIFKLVSDGKLKEFAKEIKFEFTPDTSDRKIFDHIFEEYIQQKLINPTFVLDYPIEFSPLAKSKVGDAGDVAERFELFIAGEEIANAYSELNDPEEQRKRFGQIKDEIHPMDEDFITALQYGLPPTAGLGIGIERLTMVLTNNSSIREVILFPLLRPETRG